MTRKQEIRNTLPHSVLVATVTADQLSLHELRLDEEVVQVLHLLLIRLQLVLCRRLLW
jgi:hypothetical protein